MLTLKEAIIATLIAAAVTFFTRVMPFLFFRKHKPGEAVEYLQTYIPPVTMVILVIYSVKDLNWAIFPLQIPAIAGILVTFVLHIWKNNALISIFGATAVYMFLNRLLA